MPHFVLLARSLLSPAFWAVMFAPFAAHWTAVEIIVFYFPKVAEYIRENFLFILPMAFVTGLIAAWPKNSFRCKISGTDIDINIRIGSIFSSKNTIVIATTTHFDCTIEDNSPNPPISPDSVQGQFTKRYFERPEDFESAVEREKKKLIPVSKSSKAEKPFGPLNKYAVGEVILLGSKKRSAYLVTMSTLNADKKAETAMNDFYDLFPRMWDGIRRKGTMKPIDVPLIGARFARTDLTFEKILIVLIRSFVAASREAKFVDEVNFYVSPRDYLKGGFTQDKLRRILDRECNHEKIEYRPTTNAGGVVPF